MLRVQNSREVVNMAGINPAREAGVDGVVWRQLRGFEVDAVAKLRVSVQVSVFGDG